MLKNSAISDKSNDLARRSAGLASMGDSETFRFGPFHLIPAQRELLFDGAPVGLGSRAFDLLLALVTRHGQLLSKDELMAEVWPGKVVEENNLQAHISALRKILARDVDGLRYLQTAPGRGYRFLANVEHVQPVDAITGTEAARLGPSVPPFPVPDNPSIAMLPLSVPSVPDRPSIAVLPFVNLSGDPEQEYFSDGIAEDIITALSKIRWLFITAQNSSFTYRGNSVDVRHVARELGVRYILKGSVRKAADRLRTTAQLIDGSMGNHIWADRYDGKLVDLFALQDEITKKVASVIEPSLLQAESTRSQNRSAKDLESWDMIMRARSLLGRSNRSDSKSAIAILERAVDCYPEYGPAYSMLAGALAASSFLGWDSMEIRTEEAFRLATRAVELDDTDPRAHVALGWVALSMRRTEEAAEEFRRAIDLNPNSAAAHGSLGATLSLAGRSDQAIMHLKNAFRMSPHDPQSAMFNSFLAAAHYLARRYNEAVAFSRTAVQLRHGMTGAHRIYIASLAQAGQLAEARAALEKLKQIQPDISIAWIEKHVPYTRGPMRHFLEGMHKAGLTD
jgi:TolB-like protein/DNA-binding winged helix-turn-helix (wHTH) protein/Flp pilus assembly protein TadD